LASGIPNAELHGFSLLLVIVEGDFLGLEAGAEGRHALVVELISDESQQDGSLSYVRVADDNCFVRSTGLFSEEIKMVSACFQTMIFL